MSVALAEARVYQSRSEEADPRLCDEQIENELTPGA